jgi:hypothetical protein
VKTKTTVPWTVTATERFTQQIAGAFAILDEWVRKNNSLRNRELYLEKISALKAFKNFALHNAAEGPDKSFIEIPKKGTFPAFHVRQVGPWTGYCSIDKEKKTIRWDFATHDGKLC